MDPGVAATFYCMQALCPIDIECLIGALDPDQSDTRSERRASVEHDIRMVCVDEVSVPEGSIAEEGLHARNDCNDSSTSVHANESSHRLEAPVPRRSLNTEPYSNLRSRVIALWKQAYERKTSSSTQSELKLKTVATHLMTLAVANNKLVSELLSTNLIFHRLD